MPFQFEILDAQDVLCHFILNGGSGDAPIPMTESVSDNCHMHFPLISLYVTLFGISTHIMFTTLWFLSRLRIIE